MGRKGRRRTGMGGGTRKGRRDERKEEREREKGREKGTKNRSIFFALIRKTMLEKLWGCPADCGHALLQVSDKSKDQQKSNFFLQGKP